MTSHEKEAAYLVRMAREPWRRRGLYISKVCRCEPATPCFDHIVYLADLKTEAAEKKDDALFVSASNFYWQLTEGKK